MLRTVLGVVLATTLILIPTFALSQQIPQGAVARCVSGGYMLVATGANTCAGFGGVAEWLTQDRNTAVAAALPRPSNIAPPRSGSFVPQGAVARCANGGYMLVATGANTCAGFGGVAEWLTQDSRTATATSFTNGFVGMPIARSASSTPSYPVDVASGARGNLYGGSSSYPDQVEQVGDSARERVSATTTRIDPFTYYNFSDGTSGTRQQIGTFDYYNFSNGTSGTGQRIGAFNYYNFNAPNGSNTTGTSQQIGNFQYYNFSNGSSGTSQQIGGFRYDTFSDGTNCTSQTIGTYVYTNCN